MTTTTDTRADMQNTTTHTITVTITSVDGQGVDEVKDNIGTSGMFYEVESVNID